MIWQKKRLRKGRCLIVLIGLMLLISLFGGGLEAVANDGSAAREMLPVVVADGDTLWQLVADNYQYEGDIRAAIYEVKLINQMPDSNLRPGQVVYIPLR